MAKSKTNQKSKAKSKADTKVKTRRFEEVKDDIIRLDGEVERNFVDLAELLHEASIKEHYKEWGYDSVWDFCDVELMTHSRKARYLVKIHEKIVEFGIPKKRAIKIGWTKLKEIVTIMTKKNMEALLDQAEKLSTPEIVKKVETAKDRKSGDAPKIVTLKFKMGEADGNIVTDALNTVKDMVDTKDPAVGLVMICQDWLADKGALPERTSLEDIISYAEQVYGVDIEWKIKGNKSTKPEEKPTDDESLEDDLDTELEDDLDSELDSELDEDLDKELEDDSGDDDLDVEGDSDDSDIDELDFEEEGAKDLDGDEVDIDTILTS